MNKDAIRKKYISLRKEFSKEEVQSMSSKIFENFKKSFTVLKNQNVHIFLSIEKFKEVNTSFFITYFKNQGVKIFVPKMIKGKLIAVELVDEKYLIENSFGILEPTSNVNECLEFDFIITPLLYADLQGNRVGYGKGYYDSFFSSLHQDSQKIGIGFFSPEENVDDVSSTDVPLDYLITPDSILSFNGLEKKSRK